MSEVVSTRYVKSGFAFTDEVVLRTTPRTRIVFQPGVHAGGVRGRLVRQKIGADGTWANLNEVNFNSLPADCGVFIELDTEATRKLFERLQHLYAVSSQGVKSGERRFVVAEEDTVIVIDDRNKARIIQELLAAGHSEEFWSALNESSPDLAAKLAASKIQQDREAAISRFEAALFTHGDDESFWQRFFEAHPWMLASAFSAPVFMLAGETYLGGKRASGRSGAGGVATDFLFSDDSTKSFAVVEIKTPNTRLVGGLYRGNRSSDQIGETYSMHSDLSGAVVQVKNQISVAVSDFRSVLGETFTGLNSVHPRGVLVIGMSTQLVVQPPFVIETDGYRGRRLVGGNGWSGHVPGVVGATGTSAASGWRCGRCW